MGGELVGEGKEVTQFIYGGGFLDIPFKVDRRKDIPIVMILYFPIIIRWFNPKQCLYTSLSRWLFLALRLLGFNPMMLVIPVENNTSHHSTWVCLGGFAFVTLNIVVENIQ